MSIRDEIATVAARRAALAANTASITVWPRDLPRVEAAITAVQGRVDRHAARLDVLRTNATDAGTALGKRVVAAGQALATATARSERAKRAGFTIESKPGATAAALAAAQAEVAALSKAANDADAKLRSDWVDAEAQRDDLQALLEELQAERAELVAREAVEARRQAELERCYPR